MAEIDLTELVHRAESALSRVPADGSGQTVIGFDDILPA
jgi:hypothetical protein